MVRLKLNKLYEKAQKKKLLNQKIDGLFKESPLSTSKNILFFTILLEEVNKFVCLMI